MTRNTQELLTRKIFSEADLAQKIQDWKKKEKKVVFTNGCFDLIHPGHIAYLNEAASL